MTTKGNVTHKAKVSKAKRFAKRLATRTHNMGWVAGAVGILLIFAADGYLNAWMGLLLGGAVLSGMYLGIEFGMFYCLGEVATAFNRGCRGARGKVRTTLCLLGFLLGIFCSYKALITFNAYFDARRGTAYETVDALSEKHDAMFWQQAIMLASGNPANAAEIKDVMVGDFDKRIEQQSAAREELGYAPEFAVFYRGERLTGDEDSDKLVHQRALDKASSLRNTMTICGMLLAIILTLVFVIDFTVCDEDEVEAANDMREADEEEAHLLNNHPKRPLPRVRVEEGSDVFAHKKPSFWQRLRGKAA